MKSKAIPFTFEDKEYYALEKDEYRDYLTLQAYIRGGALDGKVLVMTGPHRCDGRWIFTHDMPDVLRDLGHINEAQREKIEQLEQRVESLQKDWMQTQEKLTEKASILSRILNL